MDHQLAELLKTRLKLPLPGAEAQLKMAPALAKSQSSPRPDSRVACVLLLLHQNAGLWHFTLIERSARNPEDKHAGQLSLPGGKYEDADGSYMNCALRETHEEIGIPPQQISVIGVLSSLFIPVSNFLVHPFIGVIQEEPRYHKQHDEVADIFQIPLTKILAQENKKEQLVHASYGSLHVPGYALDQKHLWGATAMIISEFEHVLQEIYPN